MSTLNAIKKVTIQNFQSHEKTELEFEKGLNVIVGPSDQGKSAVIRAIKWVLFNEPRGNDFIRYGTNSARVEVEFSSGYKITREKSSSKNRYTIIDLEGTEQVFEGFGNDVPEEVKNVHGISKVLIDADSGVCLNIADQLEAPFLLSETGSTKAKAIGRLTGVHVIDNAIRECINDLKKETQVQAKTKKELEEITETLNSFGDLDEKKKKIDFCEKNLNSLKSLLERHQALQRFNDSYSRLDDDIRNAITQIKSFEKTGEAGEIIKDADEKINLYIKLKKYEMKIQDINKDIKEQESIIKNAQNVDLSLEKLNLAEKRKNILEKLVRLSTSYNIIASSIEEGEKYLQKQKEEIRKNMDAYEKNLRKYSKCPVCFGEIDDSTIERVINEYREELE